MDTNVTAAFQQHLGQRRANIYNMFKNPQDALGDEVVKAETDDVEKGVYADNAQNRKLGRVGQEYGGKGSRGGRTDEENGGRGGGKQGGEGDKTIDNHASTASTDALKRAAADKNAEPEVREAAKKELDKRGGDKSSEDKVDDTQKKWFIKELKSEGANANTSRFMSKNQEHFQDVLKKHGFESFDDFEDWGADHSDDDKDIEKYNKIFMQCVKKIPANNFVQKGCGDSDDAIEKEDEDVDAEDWDEKTDAEKAEIINVIGIEQLDAWKAQIDELAMDDAMDETEKAEAVSALDAEFDEFAEVSDIQKSDILYALSGYESKITFRKNGKEIKEQLNTFVIPALNADLIAAQDKADELLEECGAAPTHDIPEYWTGDLKINLAYKFYEWDETRVPETQSIGVVASFSPDSYQKRCCKNAPASQEEAEARCQYNEQIRKVANITTDIKACAIVSQNLKDNESIELTVRQLVAFKFA